MPFGLLRESDFGALNLGQLQFELGGLKLSKVRIKRASKNPCYKINAETPKLVGGGAARTEPFNKAVTDLAANYYNNLKKTTEGDRDPLTQEDKSTPDRCNTDTEGEPGLDALDLQLLQVRYEVTGANKDFVSVLFFLHEYLGPGSGFQWAKSFNYDLNRSAPIKLADLFTPKSNYLKVISNYSIRELKKVYRIKKLMEWDTGNWLEEGAGPKSANFSSWNITPNGLQITFDPYHFSVSANTGFNEVVIPYSALKPVIKPDGLLARFTK
jgi:hypothetical protein